MADLSIRNLTAAPLELKLVERFEAKPATPANNDPVSNITSRFTGLLSNATGAPAVAPTITAQGEPKVRRELSFPVAPWTTQTSDVRAPDPGREVIQLTFECEGHKYQISVPSPAKHSNTTTKLDGGPREYTAVYVKQGSCLALVSSANLSRWMGRLRDPYPLSALSIPGTHNSPTCHVALPSVRCQAVGVKQQLENGVRFFDIRVSVSPGSSDLTLVHSAFPISLTGNKFFGDMIKEVYAFLEANPTESVLMSIKREGTGKGTDQQLSMILKSVFYDEKKWYTEPRIPRLGEVRGRIVLLRRHANDPSLNKEWNGRGWGLDGSAWPDNCANGLVGSGIARVQDFYEIDQSHNIQKKLDLARAHLERAGVGISILPDDPGFEKGKPPRPFFINFLSASNFFNANCWPEKIAAKANPAITDYLCLRHGEEGKGPEGLKVGDACAGVVVTDWVGLNGDWDLIRCVVGWNARLQQKPQPQK